MQRRAALAVLLAATMSRLVVARARDSPSCVGYLSGGEGTGGIAKVLAELGWVEGSNLRFEVRVAPEAAPELAAVAAELARADVDVLLAWHPRVAALAAATRTIPIVCGAVPDPVGMGLARSLRRPGMNITGLSLGLPEAAEIRVGLFRAVVPGLKRIVAVYPSGLPAALAHRPHVTAAKSVGISWDFAPVTALADVEGRFAALNPAAEAVYFSFPFPEEIPSARVAAIAIRHRIATMGAPRDGALMYYSLVHADPARRIAAIIDKVLRGGNPAEIPFELPDRTTFVINRATAKSIGVNLPGDLLLRVTEVIG